MKTVLLVEDDRDDVFLFRRYVDLKDADLVVCLR
mgnify:CR=1 FL=1